MTEIRNKDLVCRLIQLVTSKNVKRGNEQGDNKKNNSPGLTEQTTHWFSFFLFFRTAFHNEWGQVCCGETNSLTSAAEIPLLTPVESKEALITQDFLKTVKAVFVHQLSHNRAGATLVLHASLHQVYRIYCGGSHSYKQNKQFLGLKESTIKQRIRTTNLISED